MSTHTLPDHITNPNPEVYLGDNYIVLDFETTTIGKGLALYPDNRIVLACWSYGPDHPYYEATGASVQREWAGEYELERLVDAVQCAGFVVAHNAKFELQWLARCGLDLGDVIVYDTMLAEYVIGGNRWVWHNLSLENCAQRWFQEGKINVISKMFKAGFCSTEIPESWLEDYCVQDVVLTERLLLAQRAKLAEDGQLPIVYTRCLLAPVLADIETNGMTLDPDLIRVRTAELEREYAQAQERLDELTDGINPNSPKQLGEFLYETLGFEERMKRQGGRWAPLRTPAGGRSTSAETISLLKCKTKRQREFVEHFQYTKELYNELTKYLRKFADCVESDGGLLRAQFNQ